MQRISVNVTNDCDGNQLNYNNDLPAIGNKNYALRKPFETDFLTVIGNAKRSQPLVICWVAQGSRARCGSRHPILHSNIFLSKIIYNNYFIMKFIQMYSLIFTWIVGFIYWKWKFGFANFNRKKRSTKNLLLSLKKWGLFFLKEGNPIFSLELWQRLLKSFFQLHVKNSKFFLSYFFEKDDWPKAYAGPRLPTLPYSSGHRTLSVSGGGRHFVFRVSADLPGGCSSNVRVGCK